VQPVAAVRADVADVQAGQLGPAGAGEAEHEQAGVPAAGHHGRPAGGQQPGQLADGFHLTINCWPGHPAPSVPGSDSASSVPTTPTASVAGCGGPGAAAPGVGVITGFIAGQVIPTWSDPPTRWRGPKSNLDSGAGGRRSGHRPARRPRPPVGCGALTCTVAVLDGGQGRVRAAPAGGADSAATGRSKSAGRRVLPEWPRGVGRPVQAGRRPIAAAPSRNPSSAVTAVDTSSWNMSRSARPGSGRPGR
jgi:hypothetical protein